MIDAHQHFWQIGKHDCTWPTPDLADIYCDFEPADLEPLARAAGVTGTVLVQSQESDRDTDFLLQLANESSLIQAVVGWVDLTDVSAVSRIKQLALHPKMRGLRPMLQSLLQDDWILNQNIEPAIFAMQQNNLCFDALVHVRHLSYVQIFAERYPDLPIVIDHAAKPNIAAGEFGEWASTIADLAKLPQIYCKLSGLLTEASEGQELEEMRPYIQQLYHLFGADRLMWGSDWPVLNLAPNKAYADYSCWLEMTKDLLHPISAPELDAIFGGTAKTFYRL